MGDKMTLHKKFKKSVCFNECPEPQKCEMCHLLDMSSESSDDDDLIDTIGVLWNKGIFENGSTDSLSSLPNDDDDLINNNEGANCDGDCKRRAGWADDEIESPEERRYKEVLQRYRQALRESRDTSIFDTIWNAVEYVYKQMERYWNTLVRKSSRNKVAPEPEHNYDTPSKPTNPPRVHSRA